MNIIDVFLNCDDDFRENMKANNSTYKRFTPVYLYSHDDFRKAYNSSLGSIPFRLWVHLEHRNIIKDSLGFQVAQGIKEDFPFLNLQFITRKTTITELSGYKIYFLYNEGDFKWSTFNFDLIPYNEPLKLEKSHQQNEYSLTYKKQTQQRFEFAILTALFKDEFTVFLDNMECSEFPELKNSQIGKYIKLNSDLDYLNDFLLINQDKMGVIDAASFATKVISDYKPKFLIMGGVCGGRKNMNVSLYDIIIPSKIFDYMTGKLDNGTFISYNHNSSTNANLIKYIDTCKRDIKANMIRLANYDKTSLVDNVTIHIGDFACGPWVVKTSEFMENELAIEEKKNILGLEMESLSVFRASENFQEYGKYSLVVKSVMDFTDDKKSDGVDGSVKSNASYMSYLCIRALMPLLTRFNDPKNV